MPKEHRTEAGEVHPKYWERTVREAFKNDPMRIVIELIKNAADSYTRSSKMQKTEPPYKIFVRISCKKNTGPYIEVIDNAEGMLSEKLDEALKYGTQTSRGEDLEAFTSAEKGIGLKDAMMALEDNWLITIHDGLVNERKKHRDFRTGFGKEDQRVTGEERKRWGIPNNGTAVLGNLPEYFRDRKYNTICERLQGHFLMRKILQHPEYEIYVINKRTGEQTLLEDRSPIIKEELIRKTIKILYEGEVYTAVVTINKGDVELQQRKPYGRSGLLFYYGKYSVVDFTFLRFDGDLAFSKIFGEVELHIEKFIRDPKESPLVDEKRRGLDSEHPFNRALFREVEVILTSIREEEETSSFSIDTKTKSMVLKELNKIFEDIKGKGLPPEPPIKPETYAFYPAYVTLKEYESRLCFLIVNSSIVGDKLSVMISSTNPKIRTKRQNIEIEASTIQNDYVIRLIELYCEESGCRGEIIASSAQINETVKMGVEVIANPLFSPANGFAFVPDRTSIVDGGEKEVTLCIENSVIDSSKEISIAPQYPINAPGKWTLPNEENIGKYVLRNIVKIEIPIKVVEKEHIGEKARVSATYRDLTTELQVIVVAEPSIRGFIKDIRLSPKKTTRISSYIANEGILEIYYKHPLCKKYLSKKNFRTRPDVLVFLADTLTRECIRAHVISGVKENLSRFSIFDLDNPEPEIEEHIAREYYEQGPGMHDLFMKLAKTFQVG